MKPNIYLIIIIVIGVLVYILLRKKKIIHIKKTPLNHDLIVIFEKSSYIDIRKRKEFIKIAQWIKYGHYGFRGFSSLTKEELEGYIIQDLHITKNDFKVTSAFLDLYIPS